MNTKCAICSNEINNTNNIYRGFDYSFCSIYCRTKMWTEIYQKDNNFNNPDLWLNKNNKFEKVVKWDENINQKSNNSIMNDNISDHIPNNKYYRNCNNTIYNILETSYNLFR